MYVTFLRRDCVSSLSLVTKQDGSRSLMLATRLLLLNSGIHLHLMRFYSPLKLARTTEHAPHHVRMPLRPTLPNLDTNLVSVHTGVTWQWDNPHACGCARPLGHPLVQDAY